MTSSHLAKKKKSIRVTQDLKRSKNECFFVVRSCAAKQANGFLVTLVTQLISIMHFPVDSELKHKLLVQYLPTFLEIPTMC